MGLWVFLLPGSAWIGASAERDAFIGEYYDRFLSFLAPASILLKYGSLGSSVVGLTHALPGAVWSLLAPLQLSPDVRGAANGAVHRVLGRVMLTAAAVLMVGFAIIDSNDLYAETVDFAGHGGGLAQAADTFNADRLGGALPPFNVGGQRALAAWFIFTGVQTYSTATSGSPDKAEHRAWALRHIASGLWVAAQRPLFAVARVAQYALLGPEAADAAAQADAFFYCAYFTTAAYMLAAEWAIRNAGQQSSTPVVPRPS